MTMTDTTPLDVRGLTDAELLDLARSDGTAAAKALAEAGRRDRDDRLARGRRALADIRAEGDRQAYAAYRAAGRTELCKATLLSREGEKAVERGEIPDEEALWRIPWKEAQRRVRKERRRCGGSRGRTPSGTPARNCCFIGGMSHLASPARNT